ncbi:2,3-dihydro-2,3-dihydroxybenzoate dehydrogenase [Streptomyces iconiensis]|uniref:2,3-dihydro-2,3-dihydroxybenzoate dehydrogenase n=1 Tax=Streptomyces iconiensis TaxID=1384038 RepID=A0ABT7A6V6_9ACTN|nr:2,3-dihydro-2,3-dihydroxybenzoate dehydrogenase [Streptomyces iconiensis]MDJ1137063.1 2,3-dihydro-2,3-dihydroxybenzoate dehydrogenase [Streptomyces iconiensis]
MPEHIPDAQGEFAHRTALVTGAGQGIGAAVAEALAAAGAHVAATDRDAHGIDTLASAWQERRAKARANGIDGAGTEGAGNKGAGVEAEGAAEALGTITPYVMDVTEALTVEATVRRVEEEHGGLDILVNVAGILRTAPAVELTDEDWAETFAVNTTGVFHTSRAVASRMAARGSGCVVTVGSNAAGVPRTGMAAYAASKAAATMFTKCLGLEYARSGVRCNVVAPGSTDTAMQRGMWAADTGGSGRRKVIEGDPGSYRTGIPLGRIAEPRDIAEAVVFLASDRARHITLQELYVDGGATLR